jgi:hypothetical protein
MPVRLCGLVSKITLKFICPFCKLFKSLSISVNWPLPLNQMMSNPFTITAELNHLIPAARPPLIAQKPGLRPKATVGTVVCSMVFINTRVS